MWRCNFVKNLQEKYNYYIVIPNYYIATPDYSHLSLLYSFFLNYTLIWRQPMETTVTIVEIAMIVAIVML